VLLFVLARLGIAVAEDEVNLVRGATSIRTCYQQVRSWDRNRVLITAPNMMV
jgi:hypothetical protein